VRFDAGDEGYGEGGLVEEGLDGAFFEGAKLEAVADGREAGGEPCEGREVDMHDCDDCEVVVVGC